MRQAANGRAVESRRAVDDCLHLHDRDLADRLDGDGARGTDTVGCRRLGIAPLLCVLCVLTLFAGTTVSK